jgi:hypothetical protein
MTRDAPFSASTSLPARHTPDKNAQIDPLIHLHTGKEKLKNPEKHKSFVCIDLAFPRLVP